MGDREQIIDHLSLQFGATYASTLIYLKFPPLSSGPADEVGLDPWSKHLPEYFTLQWRTPTLQQIFLSADTPIRDIAGAIKARWICEQAHQQLKEELGLDHFEGRSWTGLHRHALMTIIAYAFLQSRRLAQAGRKKESQDHRHSRASRLSGRPSLITSHARHQPIALIAESRWKTCQSTFCQSSAKVSA